MGSTRVGGVSDENVTYNTTGGEVTDFCRGRGRGDVAIAVLLDFFLTTRFETDKRKYIVITE